MTRIDETPFERFDSQFDSHGGRNRLFPPSRGGSGSAKGADAIAGLTRYFADHVGIGARGERWVRVPKQASNRAYVRPVGNHGGGGVVPAG